MHIKPLTIDQLAAYERNGFLLVADVATRRQCLELRARALQLVAEFDPQGVVSIFSTRAQTRRSDEYFLSSGDQIRFFFEEEAFDEAGNLRQSKEHSLNKIGHALHVLDPVFAAFSQQPAVLALARQLGLQQPQLWQSMYIFKQPGIGGEVVCHQDATFLYTEPLSVTGLWLALEDATIENGCLWALPGGHRLGLKKRFVRNAQGGTSFLTLDETPLPTSGLQPLEVKQGSLVILHGLLPHLSYANRSAKSRHAYALHLIDANCVYLSDNWLQPSPSSSERQGYE